MVAEQIQVSRTETSQRLVLTGSITVSMVAALGRTAVDLLAAGLSLDVDCREVTALDGSVCQVLLALGRDLKDRSANLRLINVPDGVRRFLHDGGLDSLVGGEAA